MQQWQRRLTSCLTGPLPDAWGTDTSMQQLAVLELSNTSLNSVLPAAWGLQLPALRHVDFANSGLTGAPIIPTPSGVHLLCAGTPPG